jgi:hypothetical protein
LLSLDAVERGVLYPDPLSVHLSRTMKPIEVALSLETELRQREIQLLINIAEPDPEYQPFVVTDEASLLDAVGTEPDEIAKRLEAYFGAPLRLDLRAPIWRLVDAIKRLRPDWPDEPGPS